MFKAPGEACVAPWWGGAREGVQDRQTSSGTDVAMRKPFSLQAARTSCEVPENTLSPGVYPLSLILFLPDRVRDTFHLACNDAAGDASEVFCSLVCCACGSERSWRATGTLAWDGVCHALFQE